MTAILPKIAEIASDTESEASPVSASANPSKNRLVARWLMNENAKLYCEWLI